MSASVQAITFATVDIEISFLVWWYTLTILIKFGYQDLGNGHGDTVEILILLLAHLLNLMEL